MRRVLWLTALSLGLGTGSVHAQGYPGVSNPASRPAFSPYLNLLRRDTPLVTNYFGLVQPQVNFQNSIQQLETQQAFTSGQQAAIENTLTLPATGHASHFMTQSRYFLTNGAQNATSQFGGQPALQGGTAGMQGNRAVSPAKGSR